MPNQRWAVRVDDLTDDELAFFGWIRVANDGEFSLFLRPHDGEQQTISNDPPRFLILDDYNDATHISRLIMKLPDAGLHT